MPTSRTPVRKKRKSAKQQPRVLPRARVPGAVKTLSAPSGTARFAAGKALYVTAEKDAGRVYPCFETVAGLLDSDSKIVRWEAIRILAALASADTARKLDAILDRYLAIIQGGDLISAANVIQGAGRIARSRPDLADRIVAAILGVERATYRTAECRNVAIGRSLKTLREMGPDVCRRPAVAAFVRRQTANRRRAVAQLAGQMAAEPA